MTSEREYLPPREPLFGTDGIRASIHASIMCPEHITRFGKVLGQLCRRNIFAGRDNTDDLVVIGRDTRASGLYLEHALIAGFLSQGIHVKLVGVMPTAAVALNTKLLRARLGIMISASHNPHHDNGLKIFDGLGFKINDEQEQTIEQKFYDTDATLPPADIIGPTHVINVDDAAENYVRMLSKVFPIPNSLHGMKIVVDSAHGAASPLAARVFTHFGCNVVMIGAEPNGSNINRGFGSEAPEQIRNAVIREQAQCGIAFDGDADRAIFIDEHGHAIDGDGILALIAIDLKAQGKLNGNALIATVMSSVALDRAVAPHNINVFRTTVGDKAVAAFIRANNYSFGGENSGHLLLYPYTTTGDGLLSALKFLHILKEKAVAASRLLDFFTPSPRLLKNIVIDKKIPLVHLPRTQTAVETMNLSLKDHGRVMMRYSGTENKMRVLVEASTQEDCLLIANQIADIFCQEIALTNTHARGHIKLDFVQT